MASARLAEDIDHGSVATVRDLIITENVTLDGVIDATEGWFAPAGDENIDQSDIIEALRVQREGADALLMGRVTFEEMRGYWPLQTDDTTGVADYLNRVSKYVVSSTLDDPAWEHTTVLRGELAEEVRALKSEPGSEIVCTGSMTLVAELIAAQLVDEYRLFVYQVVLRGQAAVREPVRRAEAATRRSGAVSVRDRALALPPA